MSSCLLEKREKNGDDINSIWLPVAEAFGTHTDLFGGALSISAENGG